LDLACGTGILTREIAEKFPNAKIVGIDITKSYLDVAKENSNSENKNLKENPFLVIPLSLTAIVSVLLGLYPDFIVHIAEMVVM